MCAKSRVNSGCVLTMLNRSTRKSLLFNLVGSTLDRNLKASELVQQRFRILVGNGSHIDFWNDD